MITPLFPLVLLVVSILAVEGLYSGSEMALLSADRLRLQAESKRRRTRLSGWLSDLALRLSHQPERILSTTLAVTSLSVVSVSTLIEIQLHSLVPGRSELIAVAIASPLIVLFGEAIPKTLGRRFADRLAPLAAPLVVFGYYLLLPITFFLSLYTRSLTRLLTPLEHWVSGSPSNIRDRLRSVLAYGKKDSEMRPTERRMIKRIFDFKDTEAKHALIPLVRVEAIGRDASVRDALARFKSHRHSRMPVYADRIDNIVGVLEVADLFAVPSLHVPVSGFLRPAHYVAETQSLEALLAEMREEDDEMVVVVDEYGGAIGILTLEDIVEEIVGDIQDEYDSDGPPYRELTRGSWMVQGRAEVSVINESLKIGIPDGDYETIGGFLLQQFGRIPGVGDELYFDTVSHPLRFVIRKANARQIEAILIERLDLATPNS